MAGSATAGVWIAALVAVIYVSSVEAQLHWSPWDDFDPNVVVSTYYGNVRGFSVPWHFDDETFRPEWQAEPLWWVRRINVFLGIPYAQAPTGRRRFKQPERPIWPNTIERPLDASYYRPACPQDPAEVRRDIPNFDSNKMSEDCLYLNVFAPNITWHSPNTLYPVMVFIHGGDFMTGSAEAYPGHVLATREVVVVTFNYRLGALGWLTTEDEHAAGNWGLWDQHLALEFVKQNIQAFRGDPNMITLMGEGAGAASVGLHIVSPISSITGTARDKQMAASRNRRAPAGDYGYASDKYFNQAIMMSGSDLSEIAYIRPFWQPRQYASELGRLVGCPSDDSYELMQCLRNNYTNPWRLIVQTQSRIEPSNGQMGWVWGPVQDGGYYYGEFNQQNVYLPQTPHDLRRVGQFSKIPIIIGLDSEAGAKLASECEFGLCAGMFANTFESFMRQMLRDWRIQELWQDRAYEALEFQYTYWPDPENQTARAQEFINFVTDYQYGTGIDLVLKQHAAIESSYMYVFEHKSYDDYLPHCMGVSNSAIIPYVFGVPFMNETILNETNMIGRQWFDFDDRNVSDFTMTLWTNFAKYNNPTPNVTRNVTWEPFNDFNLTYLIIKEHSHLWFRYRQSKYGFWSDYFPQLAKQDYFYPTATPTPAGREYIYTTGGMGALLFLLLIILGLCIYLLIYQSRIEEDIDAYKDSELPFSFGAAPNVSAESQSTTVSRRSPHAVDYQSGYLHGYHSEV